MKSIWRFTFDWLAVTAAFMTILLAIVKLNI